MLPDRFTEVNNVLVCSIYTIVQYLILFKKEREIVKVT